MIFNEEEKGKILEVV